jgi:hypothetical protein
MLCHFVTEFIKIVSTKINKLKTWQIVIKNKQIIILHFFIYNLTKNKEFQILILVFLRS